MELKEINVSNVLSKKHDTSNEGMSGLSAVALPTSLELATTIVTAMQNVQDVAAEAKLSKEEEEQKNVEEYLKTNMPLVEIVERKGKYSVYIPYDLRNDMRNWDDEYDIISWDQLRYGSEFSQILNHSLFDSLKQRYSHRAIDLYRKMEGLEEYLHDTAPDEEIYDRVRSEIPKIIEGLKALYKPLEEAATTATADSEYTFEEMSVILSNPGLLLAVDVNDGQKLAILTKTAEIRESMFGVYLQVEGEFHTCNPSLQKVSHKFYVFIYAGKKSLRDMGLTPIKNDPEFQSYLRERGAKYIQLTSNPSYMAYKGDLYRRTWRSSTAFRSSGRVMIDFARMTEMDPNYDEYFGGTANAFNDRFTKGQTVEVTDEVLMTLPPCVYGFSFVSKVWGELSLDNVSSIAFREDAYDKLVMEKDQKDMILALVQTQLKDVRADIIDGKGGGCIFLLSGRPGLGKTATAEVTAEHLKRPLYMVGVGELGTTAEELEGRLRHILDIASEWNAVLLLDECDIFMEARTDSNIQRNAMVGVFLRLLEYYQGVMFLTSNRAANIDKAFYSRISMAINFPELSKGDSIKIWNNILEMNNIDLEPEGICWLVDKYSVNGRQIKNASRNAMALALHEKRAPNLDDFCMVLDKGIEFQEAVFSQGLENDMRMTGMHHDKETEEAVLFQGLENDILMAGMHHGKDGVKNTFASPASRVGFFPSLFRGIANFFNALG